MRMADGFGKWVGLAMAGKRSPWGKGAGDGPGDSEEPSSGEPGASGGDAEPAGKPKSKPKGPRNPWLPPFVEDLLSEKV